MKKLLLTAAAILAAINMYGQGQGSVTFSTIGVPDNLRVKDPTGANASGSAYNVALYWGNAGETDPRNMQQVGAATALLTLANAGTYAGSGRTITTPSSSVNGPTLSFQVRGWATAGGITSYEQAVAAGAAYGSNPIFQLKTKDENNALETKPNIYSAAGYQGFQIAVPEPSVIGLGILGAGALLMLRRRK